MAQAGERRGRDVVEHALQRRALLADIRAGRASLADVCDAHPYLKLAARHYGEPITLPCPICARRELRHVHYVYGDALGTSAGQAKSVPELADLAARRPEFDVYVVEVCGECGWNHLIRSFLLGHAPDQPRTAADG